MKKAKLIIPAVALLAISGAASVTGTVAWFTAANTVSFATGSITAVSVDSTLTVSHIGGFVNAQKATGNATTIEQKANIKDSSFNAVDHGFYKAAFDTSTGTAGTPTSFYKSRNSVAEATDYCVSWISEFKTADAVESYDLYFDFTTSSMSAPAGEDSDLAPAFRLYAAAVTTKTASDSSVVLDSYVDGGESFVWGATAESLTYVSKAGAASGSTSTYTSTTTPTGVIGTSANAKATAASTANTAHGNAGFLGTIPASGSLKIQFVIWCEGTDSNCITANADQSIQSSFKFYSINANGYTAAA